jgi:type I restriction enzyme S subunit
MSRRIQIKDIAEFNRSTYKKSEFPEYLYYLDTSSLTQNRIESIQLLNTKIDIIPSRAQRKVKLNTILYSTVRPNQEHFGIIEKNIDNLVVSTGFTTIDVIDSDINAKYLYYLLTQPKITDYLHTIASNSVSAYPSILPDDLKNLEFNVPNLFKQQKIASVLSALDSKIELNNRINAELEAMAKTLYDYWFVQFDFPVVSSSGVEKPYKSSGGKMVWNEELKREIPEGWEVKYLQEIAKCIMGQSPKGESYNQNRIGTPLLNGPADYENGALKGRTYTTEPTRLCQKDDLVLCIRATIGNLVYAEQEFCLGRGVAAVRTNDKQLSELIYFLLIQEIERFKVQATGSIIIGITKDDLIESKCLIPETKIIDLFHKLVKPQFDKIRINIKENQQLTELRDWLLPMLMNGQVTVNEAKEYTLTNETLSMVAEGE